MPYVKKEYHISDDRFFTEKLLTLFTMLACMFYILSTDISVDSSALNIDLNFNYKVLYALYLEKTVILKLSRNGGKKHSSENKWKADKWSE
jgi:hypothetical protein